MAKKILHKAIFLSVNKNIHQVLYYNHPHQGSSLLIGTHCITDHPLYKQYKDI